MTAEGYNKIAAWFRARPACLKLLKAGCRYLPVPLYAGYPALLLFLAFTGDARFWKVLLIPAAVLVFITALRKLVNAKRPYEVLGIDPLVHKEKKGNSFPSRHVASASVIAAAFWYVHPALGITAGVLAAFIAVLRPLAGVHFPRDVIAGAAIALLLSVPAFLFLPV